MSDMKYEIQCIAEGIAENFYQVSFEELNGETQIEVYAEAEEIYWDKKNTRE